MKSRVPIYIISYNRLHVLQLAISSYLRFVDYQDLVIIDNGSDYGPLLDFYDDLVDRGAMVYRNRKIASAAELDSIAPIVEKDKSSRGCEYYVVTDPDISLEGANDDMFDILIAMLEKFPSVKIAGPMLKIDDIPPDYPDREKAWEKHIDQFWSRYPRKTEILNQAIFYQFAGIDTTFGMLRGSQSYRRLLRGVRLYSPCEARHLDWYITPDTITPDQLHYQVSSSGRIANWHGADRGELQQPRRRLPRRKENIFTVQDGAVLYKNIRTGNAETCRWPLFFELMSDLRAGVSKIKHA